MSEDLTNTSNSKIVKPKTSYRVQPSYNPRISDDFYAKKKVRFTQNLKKKQNASAFKIQKNFRKFITNKKMKALFLLQKKSKKPLSKVFDGIFRIQNRFIKIKLNLYFGKLKVTYEKNFSFEIPSTIVNLINFNDLVSPTLVKENILSNTFNKVFDGKEEKSVLADKETDKSKTFVFKEFNNFDDIHFSQFDFMELELPETITPEFKFSLFSPEQLEERINLLNSKIQKQSEILINEFLMKDQLDDTNESLKAKIKNILTSKISSI